MRRGLKDTIKDFLERKGFNVKINGRIVGFSGIEHSFDVVASKGNLVVCFDLVDPNINSFIELWGKVMDVSHARIFVVCEEESYRRVPDEAGLLNFDKIENVKVLSLRDLNSMLEKIGSIVKDENECISVIFN
ncbi:MAG: hypothetical protein DRJ51_01050 [Thermoprotei archaeon]|nr:MAG: hypothetical protein DRJ51_01050 [Thermoprotei archaeon]RLF02240.1 MAG: hypothetical protein DRJ59_04165 [Thermoprotei archaeon]